MARPIITLTTDFGTSDHVVAVMKGVILSINPEAEIIDISHQCLPFDVLDGAFMIGNAYSYFPPKTIHVVVIDPGVGTQRRPILVSGDQHYFVAPDNGVLSMVYEKQSSFTVWNVTSEHYFRQPVSNTFHGRDIFSPVAAWLSKNWQSNAFGEEIQDFVRFSMPKPKTNGNGVKGVVLRVDHFGNLITNITPTEAPVIVEPEGKFTIRIGKGEIRKLFQTFAQGPAAEPFGVIGSSGFLEICMNKGNAARTLASNRGAEVTVELG